MARANAPVQPAESSGLGPQETNFAVDSSNGTQATNGAAAAASGITRGDSLRRGYGSVVAQPSKDRHGSGSASTPPSLPARARMLAPDLLRGLLVALMALDHNTMTLHAWRHGTGKVDEADGEVVREWNYTIAYTLRTLTHLCAPGFTFLLGMGIVYFGRSRAKLGWSSAAMTKHFLVRAVVLVLISEVLGLIMTLGYVWFLNAILVALAVDYFLVGLLWMGMTATEPALARALTRLRHRYVQEQDQEEDQEEEETEAPLLGERGDHLHTANKPGHHTSKRAESISWHVHNVLLLALAFTTIWWNVWMSPTHGRCLPEGQPEPQGSSFLRFWFHTIYQLEFPAVASNFPPLAWISFAVLGLLYGRILAARQWSRTALTTGTAAAAMLFALLFVSTRVFRFGNLSEGCLQTAAHLAHPETNPYLINARSFFYVVKYPPDPAFFAYTMAANLLLLAVFGAIPPQWATKWFKPLLVFGSSALFFYAAHLVIFSAEMRLPFDKIGHETDFWDPLTNRPAYGIDNLWLYFGNWSLVLVVLYFLCQRYGKFKQRKGPDSIWRFF